MLDSASPELLTRKQRQAELELWNDQISHEDAGIIAVRSALRVLPMVWPWADGRKATTSLNLAEIAPIWASCAAWMAAMVPSEDNRLHACEASEIAQMVASQLECDDSDEVNPRGLAVNSVVFAAAHVAREPFPKPNTAAFYASIYASAAAGKALQASRPILFEEALADCQLLQQGTDPSHRPLWTTGDNPFASDWQRTCDRSMGLGQKLMARLTGKQWASTNVWHDWYQRILDGSWNPHTTRLAAVLDDIRKKASAASAKSSR